MTTLRFFVNDKRISTAVPLNDGTLLQVYPTKKKYINETAWRVSWESSTLVKPIFRVEQDKNAVKKEWICPPCGIRKPAPVSVSKPSLPPINVKDWNFKPTQTHTFPPGDYYIGDLCYVLDDELYDTVYGGYDYQDGRYTKKNTTDAFFVGRTAYGDGYYDGSDGKGFAVDAGILGICTQSCILKNEGGGQAYTFTEPVKCTFKDGIFKFVSKDITLVINTASYDSDEE